MSSNAVKKFLPIAVVGVGAIFPDSADAKQFWRHIMQGSDLITNVPAGHWLIEDYYDPTPGAKDKTYSKRGAFLPTVDFDVIEFGIPPSNLPAIDTSQLLALIVAKQVLQDATDHQYMKMDLSRIGVILGGSPLEALQYAAARMQRPVWVKALREGGLPESAVQSICDRIASSYSPWQENTFPGLLGNVVAGRVANRFNLGGTNCTTDAACAGSLAALSMAVNELQLHQSDMVITGGVDTLNDIIMYMCFCKTQALSFSGDCKPFSKQADGTILGEGIGMFALKRLEDAEKNQDKIYAVIRGIGTSSDGRSKSIYAPLSQGQAQAIRRAYADAGYAPHTVSLVEAHGTGTRAGDVAEFGGLKMAFTEGASSTKKVCALGSIKSQIGHTKAAAGAAGLFKAIMSLHHKVLPPTIKVEEPNPELDWENSPFYLNTQLRPWIKSANTPRRAGVSAFGFGGSNFHVALEAYTGPNQASRLRSASHELVLLAADNPAALVTLCQEKILLLSQESFTHLARQSQEHYDPSHLARLAIVATDSDDLKKKLQTAVTLLTENSERPLFLAKDMYYAVAADPGRVAFLFPGQGSQYLNMGADIAMTFDAAMTYWETAADIIQDGQSLADVVFPPPVFEQAQRAQHEKRLQMTCWAQPALAVTSSMYLQLLTSADIRPDCVAGHSFGELTALYAAGTLTAAQFSALAQQRGQLMYAASKNSASGMLSVAHSATETLRILTDEKLAVAAANFNSPRQLILSGTLSELEKTKACLSKHKIACQMLPVSAAFHSDLMQPASRDFQQFLKAHTFSAPQTTVFANETAAAYPADGQCLPDMLSKQLLAPVQFQKIIETMYANGVRTFIEVGPRNILSNLVKHILNPQTIQAIPLDSKGESGLYGLFSAFANLFVLGLNPHCAVFWAGYQAEKQTSPPKNSHIVKLNGTNYGKPYPLPGGSKDYPQPNAEPLPLSMPLAAPVVTPPIATIAPREHSLTSINSNQARGPLMSQSHYPLLQTYQELHRQLIEAHNTYQKMMAETHISFLNAMSNITQQMTAPGLSAEHPTLTLSAAPSISPPRAPVPSVSSPMLAPAPRPVMNPVPAQVAPMMQAAPLQPAPAPVVEAIKPLPVMTPVATTVSAPPAPPAPVAVTNTLDLKEVILNIVVEKTGYPRDMLNMDMSIEADLGIDSIKRVEILSALTEKVPNLPEIDTAQLVKIQTLGDILAYAQTHGVAA